MPCIEWHLHAAMSPGGCEKHLAKSQLEFLCCVRVARCWSACSKVT
jgi:hypothetical protein